MRGVVSRCGGEERRVTQDERLETEDDKERVCRAMFETECRTVYRHGVHSSKVRCCTAPGVTLCPGLCYAM